MSLFYCMSGFFAGTDAGNELVWSLITRLKLGEKPSRVAGLENAQWVAMDYGDVMVHIFLPDVREYYDLEHLWDDAPLTKIADLD